MNYTTPIEYKNERRGKVTDVDDATIHDLVLQIQKVNDEDDANEEVYAKYKRLPIQINVSSYGGSVYDGLALIAAMRASKTPIHTYVMGPAMSMGLIIAVCGHKRFADRYATYMWHDIASVNAGKLEEMEQSAEQLKILRKSLNDMLVDKTKIKPEKIKEMIKSKRDWYFTAEEAKKLGVCDELL